MNMLENNTNIM